MKNFITMLLVCALALCMLASCGGSDKLFDYNYDEYLSLGTYKGVEVSASAIDEEVQAQIDSILAGAEGAFEFWFSDDDLFLAHPVHVTGTLDQGPALAEMDD